MVCLSNKKKNQIFTVYHFKASECLNQQHSSISSSPELYSFLLMALKLVLSFRVRCRGDMAEGSFPPLKSFWTFGHSPLDSILSTRVTWKVGTRVGSTAIWSTVHSEPWSPLSTHRSIRAPLSPQGSFTARWSSSSVRLCIRQSGRMRLEQHRMLDPLLRLWLMVATTSAARVSSGG